MPTPPSQLLATPSRLEGLPRRMLRRAEYDTLVVAGAFDDEKIELLFGEIVPMSPQGPAHAWFILQLRLAVEERLGGRAVLTLQAPLAGADESEPEPDLALVHRSEVRLDRHPERSFLVIEVATTSQRKDKGPKALLYARTGVPEYWVVDTAKGTLTVHQDPNDEGYGTVKRILPSRGTELALVAFPDVQVPVGRIFHDAGFTHQ